jgi:carboxylate-amine ligase
MLGAGEAAEGMGSSQACRMSSDFTIGVEEEYQLVDADTGALRSRARDVLTADWTAEIRPELQETTLEIGTRICDSAQELDRELRRLRFQVATTAAAEGLEIAAAGTHPFSRWEEQVTTSGGRYDRIVDRFRRIARDEHNFGMHVHVAVPPEQDRIALLNVVRVFIPHLIALCASSPFYEGDDSGYSSYRMVLWRRWPNSGIPPRLTSRDEYRRFVDHLIRSGAIGDERNLYWGIRPHAIYPTLEFRVTDACPCVDDAVAVAALIRALVVAANEGVIVEPRCAGYSEVAEHAVLANNEWGAMRFGLDARLVDPGADADGVPIRDAIRRLVDRVGPVAERLGDGPALGRIETILERGNGADRMRRVVRAVREHHLLVRWLVAETMLGTGIDRRRAQRGAAA